MRRPEGKRPLGRPRIRWEDDIKVYFKDVGWEVMDWIALVQNRDKWRDLVTAVTKLRFPYNAWNFLTS